MSRQRKITNNHKLISWLERDVGGLRNWPLEIRQILTRNRHPDHKKRYAFICFLYGNFHYDPHYIVNVMLNTWRFDNNAINSLRKTADDLKRGWKQYRYFDLGEREWVDGL